MYFSFSNYGYLIFLLIIPFMIFFHFYNLRNLRGRALKFANFEAIARIKGIDLFSKNILPLVINILIVTALVLSISGLTLNMEMDVSTYSYVIAIDSSESMGATDLSPDRLTVAKETAIEFVNSLPFTTNVAVVSYTGNTFIEQDLTSDKGMIRNGINQIDLAHVGGTDLYEAVSISFNLLKNEPNRAIIVMSDGQLNVGNLNEVIDYAVYNNVVVYTMGIGTIEGGQTKFGISKLDENSLKALAYSTEGKYYQVDSRNSILNSFSEIVQMTRKIGSIPLNFYLILLSIVLFIIGQIWTGTHKIAL
ncbi:VWA domain-containing protein [Candidatus Pacearchaeota archaeon]|nr:VWA domain-containing protein [Candidatus Pacearchaeota archaeon]